MTAVGTTFKVGDKVKIVHNNLPVDTDRDLFVGASGSIKSISTGSHPYGLSFANTFCWDADELALVAPDPPKVAYTRTFQPGDKVRFIGCPGGLELRMKWNNTTNVFSSKRNSFGNLLVVRHGTDSRGPDWIVTDCGEIMHYSWVELVETAKSEEEKKKEAEEKAKEEKAKKVKQLKEAAEKAIKELCEFTKNC